MPVPFLGRAIRRRHSAVDEERGGRVVARHIHKLPTEIVVYKAAQKEDNKYITFHGELSPYSNFHHSRFPVNNHMYHSSEQWIQFQKAMLFGDSLTANQILSCNTPYETKHLSYNINGFDIHQWGTDDYDICLDGITEKFLQDPLLLKMLKGTAQKTLVEASLNKQWGTGVQLGDPSVLKPKSWYGRGWMSEMLNTIHEKDIPTTN